MKTNRPVILALAVVTLLTGCAEKQAATKKAEEEAAAAKARADATRKEMETVPKVFRPQYHNKRLEPEPNVTQPKQESEKKP